jgi:general secretion pathway protein H
MRPRGFTLMEILVVLVLTGILTAAIGLSLVRRDSDRLRDETERLGLLLRAARSEAILTGRPRWVRTERDGYRFLGLAADGTLATVDDAMFRARVLDDGITLSRQPAPGSAADAATGNLVFLPTGEVTDARIVLQLGNLRRTVSVRSSGEIELGADSG